MTETEPGASEQRVVEQAGTQRPALEGNRLALIGAVVYLLEWVAILAASPPGPLGPGTAAEEIVTGYADHAGRAAFSAAWFAIVLVGRVLFIAGVKASMRGARRQLPLLDLALGAMAVSVVLEIAAYSVVAAAARLAADGSTQGVVVALDGAAYWVNVLIFGPIGVSVLAASVAMLRSRLFPAWLCWLGVVAGLAGILGCLLSSAIDTAAGDAAAGVTSIGALGLWVWMLVTGVLLFRRTPRAG